ncbi:MAG: HEAT repeat domain-containing protein [Candidatus Binatia bacterium]
MQEIVERGGADSEEIEALAECLGSECELIQRRAAETLAALGQHDTTVQALLLRSLQSGASRRRWGAVFALSLTGQVPLAALPVLLQAMGAQDGDVRWAAADIVTHMKGEAAVVDALRSLLHNGDAWQRKMAVYCLRDLDARSPEIEAALRAALSHTHVGVRLAAISGLARLACDRPLIAHELIAMLDDADSGVRRAAAAALGTLGEHAECVMAALRHAAGSADQSLRRAAERSLRLLYR